MSSAFTVARKELRALFQSPVAVMFLGVFLLVTLFTFFSWSKFFARNLADVRPLFEWLPLLLIFLVSAVTMRAWAEERKAGTLEVLLTLPVSTRDLVLGKFLAGMGLVAAGLALTLPLPFVVAHLGHLDWGPVIGGYVAALLLASAYLAIGLCVSARTDNQVVALLVTLVIGGVLYLLGTERITGLFGNEGSEILRMLGTGSRFESVQRGVIDLRDLAYYLGITVTFLVLNGYFLEAMRLDERSPTGRSRNSALLTLVALVGANAIAANIWLAHFNVFRLDLTENGEYSISPVTRQTLASLDEPLTILGLFSERTHPLLAPLIPQIEDQLAEYQIAGGGKVNLVIRDPNEDPDFASEVGEQYGVKPVPFGVSDRTSQSVVNSYFHIVVKYGDQYEVLQFQDLIDVKADEDNVDVRLRNFEYDLTRTIRKVSQEFQPIAGVLSKLPEGSTLTMYVSPATLPPSFSPVASSLEKAGQNLANESGGKLAFKVVDPSKDQKLAQDLVDKYGIQPMVTDLFAQDAFWLYGLVQAGQRSEPILPKADLNEGDAQRAVETAIRRVTPGQMKRVALFTENPEQQQPNPNIPPQFQPPQKHPDYHGLEEALGDTYEVDRTQLDDGFVPEDVDVLIVGKTGETTAKQRYAIDQFLMRGGSVIALAGRYRVEIGQQGINATHEDPGLDDLLKTWHVDVEDSLVYDTQNAPFPVPVQERRGGFTLQRIQLMPYPLFPDVRQDGMAKNHPALAGIDSVTMPWASPLIVDQAHDGIDSTELLQSSSGSWVDTSGKIEPDFQKFPDAGFGPVGQLGTDVLGVALTGTFDSNFKGVPSPIGNDAPKPIEKSVVPGKLVVLGSSEMTSDLVMQLAQQMNGEVHRGNIVLVHNLIDWATADTELLSIRGTGAFDRTLRPMDDAARSMWEWISYAGVAIPLALIVLFTRMRRATPIPLVG
jgi:ABC-2 type transport system permease protein